MIDEHAVENLIVDRILARENDFTTRYSGKQWFRHVEGVGMYDIDPDNVRDFVRVEPACLVEYGGDSASDMDNAGKSSQIMADIMIYVIGRGMYSPSDTSDDINALAREVKAALRGYAFNIGDAWADLRYRAASARSRLDENSGLIVKVLRFEFKTIDHPY